ncbi:SdrD B-like domain-containing protein [Corynebacterium ulcerans]|uniref:SdrD B-like domain-containing protein n=1 Tax=Corynebacterium ulcerans TaxID=65058 RepID=UPI00031C1964|nr:SdrD B-like domain-containing protein [Corynebacterium ulcerans]
MNEVSPFNQPATKRLGRTVAAVVTATSVSFSGFLVPTASAAAASAYSDNIGRNEIGTELLEKLKPEIVGGSQSVSVGDSVTYKYTVKTGFPQDPNNVTAQRWVRMVITQDPKVPFTEAPAAGKFGIPDGAVVTKTGDNEWTVVLGAEYEAWQWGDTEAANAHNDGLFKVNNVNHPLWATSASKASAWVPPADLAIEIPAKVNSADGAPFAGSLTVTSGRLADVALKDTLTKATFVSNDGQGTCTWDSVYETKLLKEDIGYWVENVLISSDPESVKDYPSLPIPYQDMVRYRPTLTSGEVFVGNRSIGKVEPVNTGERGPMGYPIGELYITENVPPFTSKEWLDPQETVRVKYQYTNPCGSKVTADTVKNPSAIVPATDPSVTGPGFSLERDYTYVEASGVYVGLIRPPEDASATAQFVFNQDLVSLGDYVWFDRDADGKQGDAATEPGVSGVQVSLLNENGQPVNKPGTSEPYVLTTDASGKYLFEKLPKGKYKVQFDASTVPADKLPEGISSFSDFTSKGAVPDQKDDTDSDVTPGGLTSTTDVVDLQQDRTDIDAGLIAKARFSVSKVLDGTDAGKQVGTTARELADGKLVVEHKITVKNETPGIPGKAPQVLDEPLSVPGFEIESLIVNETPVQKTGKEYLIAGEKDFKASEGKQEYLVKVTYKRAADNKATGALTKAEADAIGECSDQSGTGTTKGIVNKVYLGNEANEADTDTEKDKNNWDCVPVKGVDEPVGSVSVGDFVWIDSNRDGIQDADEKGLAGVELQIVDSEGNPVKDINGEEVKNMTTGADGKYSFDNLPTLEDGKHYTVKVVKVPAGYEPTKTGQGTQDNDSSKDSAKTYKDLSQDGAKDDSLDFGFVEPEPDVPGSVSVGDFVWVDANGNGIQDEGEEGLSDVVLELVGPDGKPVTDVNGNPVKDVTTRADGKYTFSDLPVLEEGQKYTVKVVDVPAGYAPTKTDQGTSDTDSSTDEAETVADLTKPGAEDNSLDFGFIQAEDPNTPDFPDDEDPEGPSFNWKYLIPFALIPVIGALVWGSSQGSSSPGTPAPTAPKTPGSTTTPATAAPQAPESAAPKAPMKRQLAATGASVLYTLLAALLLVIAGVFLVRLRRQD